MTNIIPYLRNQAIIASVQTDEAAVRFLCVLRLYGKFFFNSFDLGGKNEESISEAIHNTAVPRQTDLSDMAPLNSFQLYRLQTKHEFEWHANEPSQTQADDDNSFVCPLPWLTDFQCRPLLTSCETANYVNSTYSWNRYNGANVT